MATVLKDVTLTDVVGSCALEFVSITPYVAVCGGTRDAEILFS